MEVFGIISALLVTLAIEMPLYYVFKKNDSFYYLLFMMIATTITNVVMNVLYYVLSYYQIISSAANGGTALFYFIAEIIVIIIEGVIASIYLKHKGILASLVANGASVIGGGLFNILIVSFLMYYLPILVVVLVGVSTIGVFVELFFIFRASLRY